MQYTRYPSILIKDKIPTTIPNIQSNLNFLFRINTEARIRTWSTTASSYGTGTENINYKKKNMKLKTVKIFHPFRSGLKENLLFKGKILGKLNPKYFKNHYDNNLCFLPEAV